MNSEFEALRDVIARLESAGIEYMLTGSIAMSLYAEPRMTRDIDIVVALREGDARRVSELFSPDYYISEEAVRAAIAERRMFNLFSLAQLVKIDLIVLRDEEFPRHEFARREQRDIAGTTLWVVAKEDLVLAKLAWASASASALQLRDVGKLLASGVDEAYLREWSAKLGVDDLLRKCMNDGHDGHES
jgi:hypothetical protein